MLALHLVITIDTFSFRSFKRNKNHRARSTQMLKYIYIYNNLTNHNGNCIQKFISLQYYRIIVKTKKTEREYLYNKSLFLAVKKCCKKITHYNKIASELKEMFNVA